MLYGERTWEELKALAAKDTTTILVLGSVEEHGRHLPVNTDIVIPWEIAKRVAERTNSLLLPPMPYGYSYTLRAFPGTLSLKHATLVSIIRDIVSELVRNGFRKILILNGHGSNEDMAKCALKELHDELEFTANIVSWWNIPEVRALGADVGHADENEASLYLHFRPQHVRREKARPEKHSHYFGYSIPLPKDLFTASGFHGSLASISPERGEKLAAAIEDKLVKLIESNLVLKEE